MFLGAWTTISEGILHLLKRPSKSVHERTTKNERPLGS
jgi:hypothetical protein